MPKPPKSKKTTRKVIYAKPSVQLCVGKDAITANQMKELLGWTEESENVKFKTDYHLKDRHGNKIRLLNDVTNRPIYMSNVESLIQEILRGKWEYNAEPIIVGKTGLILNGQHQGIALILADQEWRKTDSRWKTISNRPPKLDKLIAFGVSEADNVVNTMDTCKPRSLADVLYRSVFFASLPKKARVKAARVCDYAVRLLWDRTGAGLDAFSPRRTHSESLDFINRHPRLLEAVRFVLDEDEEGKVSNLLSPGYAAGLLYLMAASATDSEPEGGQGYAQTSQPNEEQVDFDNWDAACDFWTRLAQGDKKVQPVRESVARLIESEEGFSFKEKLAMIVKGFEAFSTGSVSAKDIELEYVRNEEGQRVLSENPTCGGIDLGSN